MTMDEWRFWMQVANMAGTVVVGIYVWIANRHKVTDERISALQKNVSERLENHHDRLLNVEQEVAHAPSHEDFQKLAARLEETTGAIRELRGAYLSSTKTLEMIHQYLLTKGKN